MDHDLDAMLATLHDWMRGVCHGDVRLAQDAWTEDGIYLTEDGPTLARDKAAGHQKPCNAGQAVLAVTGYSRLGPGLARLTVRLDCTADQARSCPLASGVIVMRCEAGFGPAAASTARRWRICLMAPPEADGPENDGDAAKGDEAALPDRRPSLSVSCGPDEAGVIRLSAGTRGPRSRRLHA